MVIRKKNGKLRVCIDFTNLNNGKLPKINRLVDSATGHEIMSFLDAYSGYYQISFFRSDQECTNLISTMGFYYYKVMPFGLKNAGTSYQRLITKMFREEIWKSMEVYVDDMLVKSKKDADNISDLGKTFEILRHYKMKLNTTKCTLGIRSRSSWGLL